MLKIRLKKTGRKHNPFYRIVLMKNLSKRDGKSIDDIGFYNPIQKLISFDRAKLHKYINAGAYPTPTLRHLIKKVLNF